MAELWCGAARNDRARVADDNACQPVARLGGFTRRRATMPRGKIRRRKTIAGRRCVHDGARQRRGLHDPLGTIRTYHTGRLVQLQNDLRCHDPAQQADIISAGIKRQHILGRGQHDVRNGKHLAISPPRHVQIRPASRAKIGVEGNACSGGACAPQRRKQP